MVFFFSVNSVGNKLREKRYNMPKEITHWILAEKVYRHLDDASPLKKIIVSHKNLYMAGAVIADTPFYSGVYEKSGGVTEQSGQKFHDNPLNSYEPLTRVVAHYAPEIPEDVLSLLLGIVSHIHADSSFHPLVYYLSGFNTPDKKKKASTIHHTLEAFLDIYYIERFQLQNKGFFSEVLNNIEMEERRFMSILSHLFSIEQTRIKKAVKIHSLIQKRFDENIVKILLRLLNAIPGADLEFYLSSFYPLRRPESDSMFRYPFYYRHPVTGEEFRHSVKDLEKKMIQETLKVFGFIESGMEKNAVAEAFFQLKGPNLYTGMVGAGKAEMRYFSVKKDIKKLILQGKI